MDLAHAIVSYPDSPQRGRAPHGSPILIHATGAETGGTIGMWESFVPPGKGPEPHTHSREWEVFRVITGTFRFTCGDDTFDAPPGTVVSLPPHVPHGWVNIGDTMGQVMAIVSPAGFEQLFIEVAKLDHPTPREVALIERSLGIENEKTRRL